MICDYVAEMNSGQTGYGNGCWLALLDAIGPDADSLASDMLDLHWTPRAEDDEAEIVRKSTGEVVGVFYRF